VTCSQKKTSKVVAVLRAIPNPSQGAQEKVQEQTDKTRLSNPGVGNPDHSPIVLCADCGGALQGLLERFPSRDRPATSILDIREWFIHSDKIMKRKTLITVFAALCAACAQTSNYTAVEAAKHVGETATVTDRVDGVQHLGKGNIFLNMGGKYPNQAFTAFIPSSSAGQF
jgi:hypothetical protein